jgi:hypothetical protein
MPTLFTSARSRSVVGLTAAALVLIAVLAPSALGSRPITHTGGATWSSTSSASSISATVYVSAIDCSGVGSNAYAGQQSGIELFGSDTSNGTPVYPFDFAGFYSYCHGGTAIYSPQFITANRTTGKLTFKTAGFDIAPGDPLEVSIVPSSSGLTLTITDVNTHQSDTATGPKLGPSTGWTAGTMPIFGGTGGEPYLNTSVLLVDNYTPSGGPTTITGPVPFAPVVFQALTVSGSIVGGPGGNTDSKWVGPTGDAAADATAPSLGDFVTSRVKLKPPTLGTNADVTPVSGFTLIRIPGTHKFVKLIAGEQIPNGSEIDARHGSIQITLALPNGKSETGVFYDGRFFLNQNKKNGDATATLSGGSFASCKAGKKGHSDGHIASIAKTKTKTKSNAKKKIRSLWSNAHGNFTTKGAGGSAAVLGTKWYTEDRCDGTYFKVIRDKIKVTAYYPHRHTVVVKQGHSFLAPAKP